jgi:phage minor structural protein
MSYPILYSATETNFDHNGIGILSACVSCDVTEEANGIFELAMTYPMDGVHFAEIGDRAIIKAKADHARDPQLFRVYAISKPMNGIVTVLAEHISYELSGIPVKPFSASTAASALAGLKENAVIDCPFDFWTDKETSATFKATTPASIRSRLGGVRGSILDAYGGEYEFDNYTVKLHNNRGENRGVSIRYGKNLTDIQQDQNCSSVATGVYPYWYLETDVGNVLIELPEKIVPAPGTHPFKKIRTVDFSQDFEFQPTEEQLRSRTEKYIKDNEIGVPSVSLTVSFAQLEQTEEYKNLAILDRVGLFDVVNVEFPALGVSANAKAVKVVYDVVADRVKSVTLGSVRTNIADTIATQQQEILQTPTKTDLRKAQESATAWLTNGKGYAYFRKDDLGNIKDILFMDTQDPETAVNVMRVGQSGIGFSRNGVNGLYHSAWTLDGNFVADFITSGTIFSGDQSLQINLSGNKMTITGQDGNSVELSSGDVLFKANDGTLKMRIGKVVGGNYLLSLIPTSGESLTFLVWDDGVTLRAKDYDTGGSSSHRIGWKSIDGIKTLIGE